MLPNHGFGGWEAHTKGIGSKLLEKWGHKKGEGLGKEQTGIATPISPFASPQKHMSLDHVLEYHNSFLNSSFESGDDSANDNVILQFSQVSLDDTPVASRNLKGLEDSLANITLNEKTKFIPAEQPNNKKAVPKEVLVAVDNAIKKCQSENSKLESDIRYQVELIHALKRHYQEHTAKDQVLTHDILGLTKFSDSLKKLTSAIENDPKTAHSAFEEIFACFPVESTKFGVRLLAERIFCKELRSELKSGVWTISSGKLPHSMIRWKFLFGSTLTGLLSTSVASQVTEILSVQWNPRKDSDFHALRLVEELRAALPHAHDSTILPPISCCLSACISAWKPTHSPRKSKKVPLHTCLFVWGPLMGLERMDELFEQVAEKLVGVLHKKRERWKMNDVRLISMLEPWSPLFQEPPMRKLREVLLRKCFNAINYQSITKFVPAPSGLGLTPNCKQPESKYQQPEPNKKQPEPNYRQPEPASAKSNTLPDGELELKEPTNHQEPDRQEPDRQEPDRQEPDRQEPDRQEPDHQEPDRQEPDRQDPHQEPDHQKPGQEPNQEPNCQEPLSKPGKPKPHHTKPDHQEPDQNCKEPRNLTASSNHEPNLSEPNYDKPNHKKSDYNLQGFAWEWIPIWAKAGLVDLPVFADILTRWFFPRWCEFLIEWMKNGGDLDEIAQWYLFWRKLFQTEFIAKGYLIEVFVEVLHLMQNNIPK